MGVQIAITVGLGAIVFRLGMSAGKALLKRGATAQDLFKGRNRLSLLFLGLYIGLLLLAVNVPQMQMFPLEWRIYGMQTTWTLMRLMLLGFCGLAWTVSWHTARSQVLGIVLLVVLGIGGFTGAEAYFLAPIYPDLANNLQANGVFKQTSMTSCAPAALATVLHLWKLDATEVSVAKAAQTSRLGTSMPQLITAARSLGMNGIELAPTWEQIQRINRPGVLGVWMKDGPRRLPHAVALLAMDANRVAIGDPAFGKIYLLNRREFQEIWRSEYVPIWRSGETTWTMEESAQYLKKAGYPVQGNDLKSAVQAFQTSVGVKATGFLDTQTILLLMGPSLVETQTPTLAIPFS